MIDERNMIAIHESEDSEKVVKFIPQIEFQDDISRMLDNGNIYGVYLEGGEVVAVDISQVVYRDILK